VPALLATSSATASPLAGYRKLVVAPARLRAFAVTLCGLIAVALTGCGVSLRVSSSSSKTFATSGAFHGGQQPLVGALIQLYAVGTASDGSSPIPLPSTRVTTSNGTNDPNKANANAGNAFNSFPARELGIAGAFQYPPPESQVYIVGTGGNPGLGSAFRLTLGAPSANFIQPTTYQSVGVTFK
jgi:hypothetical protein